MNPTYDDVEHYGRIVSGFESITNRLVTGDALNEDGRYAQSVLQLHAQDELGVFAGNESIVDSIKKGAKNVSKWIMELLKSIKAFFLGDRGQKVKAAGDNAEKAAKVVNDPKSMFGAGITQTLDIQANFTISKSAAEKAKKDFNALSAEAKKEAEEEFKEKVASLSLDQIGESSLKKIQSSIESAVNALKRPAEEIKRIDGMEDSGLASAMGLGDGDAWLSIVADTVSDAKHLKTSSLSSGVKAIVALADGADKDLKEATTYLEGLTKKIGNSDKPEDQRKLSRGGQIITEFTKIVKGYQKLVLDMNAALTQAIRSEQDKVILAILRKNKISIVSAANKIEGSDGKENLNK